ncbi:MAG TPA: Smr/MutS family protein [Flavobacteriaceae bacterium]|nr:Smr/MutS family protein [Flavobacteriaceae bacterium]
MKIGTKVSVIDDDLAGIVHEITGNRVVIKTPDEFLLSFHKNELVVIPDADLVSETKLPVEHLLEKQQPKRKKTLQKRKKKELPAMEVDLHIHQLVNSSAGMTNHEMLTLQLDTAKRQLDFAIKKRIPRVVFIHGVGEGTLKLELQYLFGRYDNVNYYDANYQKYGLGATEVRIFQNAVTN